MNNPIRLTVCTLLLAVSNLSAATLYVSLESTNPTPPYATWATAATNIQDAVDAGAAGDEVVVTNGIYTVGGRAVDGTMTNRVTDPQAPDCFERQRATVYPHPRLPTARRLVPGSGRHPLRVFDKRRLPVGVHPDQRIHTVRLQLSWGCPLAAGPRPMRRRSVRPEFSRGIGDRGGHLQLRAREHGQVPTVAGRMERRSLTAPCRAVGRLGAVQSVVAA